MTDLPPSTDQSAPSEPIVDTTPADPQRTGVTYGIVCVVLALLITYFVVHARAR